MVIISERSFHFDVTLEAGSLTQLDAALATIRDTLEQRLGQIVLPGSGVRVLRSELRADPRRGEVKGVG